MTTGTPELLRRSEKSPWRFSSVGTVESTVSLVSCRVRSHDVKKNVFPRRIGPPNVPPNWFSRNGDSVAAK